MTANKKYYPLSIGVFGLCFGATIPLFREIQWNAARTGAKIIARYSYGIYLTHFPIMVFVLLNNRRYPRFKIIHQLPPLAITLDRSIYFSPAFYRRRLAGPIPFHRGSWIWLGSGGRMGDFAVCAKRG